MYTLEQYDNLYREFITKDSREFKYKCIVDDKTLDNYQLSTFSIESNLINEGNEYSIGNLASKRLDAIISADVNIEEGSKIVLACSLKVIDNDVERWLELPLGSFTVHTVNTKKISKTIVAYDNLYAEILTRKYSSNLTYSATDKTIEIGTVLRELCSTRYIDVEYYDNDLYSKSIKRPLVVNEKILRDDGKYEVVESDSDKVCLGMTVGQTLGYIASYLGGNFIIDGDNKLKLVKCDTNNVIATYNDNKFNLNSRGKSTYNLERIDCTTHEGNVISVGSGDEKTAMKIENPFLDDSRIFEILQELKTISYNSINIKTWGDPTIQPGDVIRIYLRNTSSSEVETIKIPVMRIRLQFSGGCFNEVEAMCLTASEKKYEYKGTLATKIDDMSSTVTSVSTEIDRIRDSLDKLSNVKDYVDQMDLFVGSLSTELSYSKKYQYELLLDKIMASDSDFNSRYTAVISNKYLN